MDQPSIFLFGELIQEPICTLTDFIVTYICLLIYLRLGKSDSWNEKRMWRYYFFFMMTATFLGGLLGHAFLYKGVFQWMKLPGWIFGMISMNILSQITINHLFIHNKKIYGFASILNVSILIAMLSLQLSSSAFKYVQIHSTLLLSMIILPIQFFLIGFQKNKQGILIIVSLLIAGLGSFVFSNKLAFDKWFNHLDISHILLALSMLVMSKAAFHPKEEISRLTTLSECEEQNFDKMY